MSLVFAVGEMVVSGTSVDDDDDDDGLGERKNNLNWTGLHGKIMK